ncbi:MAG TPA: Crp/Fnr family transcriptional regulator [Methylomusa anaerophila]|uniref:Global nitrogen regulator n=1 Tax=Methylomusa anaerophila TaxID=1930071 RepID=A0A348AG24_9FIRM|nr:Crp/Fnr family transcriptional regulator [Methylomusa anaerophila]BBB90022.1 global nitrogen regulator [Methylomusa anaerophila]HML88249.1 Crp/Fnr family transcriptional regulator [Methylomusa anaerophila]
MNTFTPLPSDTLKNWSPDEVAIFKKLARPMQVGTGRVIFREEDCSEYIYLIETGHVKLSQNTEFGNTVTVAVGRSGEVVGVAGVLTGEQRAVFIETLEPCMLWKMNKQTFVDMLHQYPSLAVHIAAELGKRLRRAHQTIMNITSYTVERRLALLLLELATTATPNDNRARITFTLTHQEMADMIGACRQTVTIALGQFKKEGLIKVGKHIEIIDAAKLKDR